MKEWEAIRKSVETLLAEIDGHNVFAWLPVRLKDESGFFRKGWTWFRWVRKKRYIGFPDYFYTVVK